jgi:hypothetical protein
VEVGGSLTEASLGKKFKTLFEKQTKSKRTGGLAQVAEHSPIKNEALKSISSTEKKTRGCGGHRALNQEQGLSKAGLLRRPGEVTSLTVSTGERIRDLLPRRPQVLGRSVTASLFMPRIKVGLQKVRSPSQIWFCT